MLKDDDLQVLRCPASGAPLRFEGARRDDALHKGALRTDAPGDARRWCVEDGLARLYQKQDLSAIDLMMRMAYDSMPGMHDPGVRWLLPLWGGGFERQIRGGLMPRLELESLRPRADGRPLRVLEVSIGTGANLPWLYRHLPPGLPVELWGVDLSVGMLDRCGRRIRRMGYKSVDGSHVRLLMADAHALPFVDDAFDRVFHVGGIAAFGDPARAIREMVRVARPGTPITLVDEAFDNDRWSAPYHRWMFKMLTAFDPDVHVPREHLPADAEILHDDPLTRFYYCLTFRVPALRSVEARRVV